MSKRALVAGAGGLIGSFLCDHLLANQYQVIAVDNFISGSRENLGHLNAQPNFTLLTHDIIQPFEVKAQIDEVYHLACPASPDDFDTYPLEIMDVCAMGTRNLLDLAHAHGAKLLFTSTSEVYGDPQVHPQPETYFGNVNSIGKRSCYDEGKRFAEALIMNYHQKFGIPYTIARVFNTYGPRLRADDGRVISNFMVQAQQGKPLILHGDGSQTRSFCYVTDLIRGIHLLMTSQNTQGEVFNIGNTHECTIRELAETLREVIDRNLEIQAIPSPRSDDPTRRRPDTRKIEQTIGWYPQVSLKEGLQKTWEDFKTHHRREAS